MPLDEAIWGCTKAVCFREGSEVSICEGCLCMFFCLFVWTRQPWNFKMSHQSPSPGSYHRYKKWRDQSMLGKGKKIN